MWIKILWIIGAAWVCQGVLVYFQIKNFQKKIAELKRHGRLGVGTVKAVSYTHLDVYKRQRSVLPLSPWSVSR